MANVILVLSPRRRPLEPLLVFHELRVLRCSSILHILLLLLIVFKGKHFWRLLIIYRSFRVVVHMLHTCKRFVLVNFLFCNCHIILVDLLIGSGRLLESWFLDIVTNIVSPAKSIRSRLVYSSCNSIWSLGAVSRMSHYFSFFNLLVHVWRDLLIIVILLLIKGGHSKFFMG